MLGEVGPSQVLLANAAYDSDALHQAVEDQGGWACTRPMPTRKRAPAFSPFLHRYHNGIKCFFAKLKQFRTVATRYEKHDDNDLTLVELVASRIWMRFVKR